MLLTLKQSNKKKWGSSIIISDCNFQTISIMEGDKIHWKYQGDLFYEPIKKDFEG